MSIRTDYYCLNLPHFSIGGFHICFMGNCAVSRAGLIVLMMIQKHTSPRSHPMLLYGGHRLMEPQNREVGKKLLNYTVLMFSLPIAIFYACNDHVFQGSYRRFSPNRDACAFIVGSDKPVFSLVGCTGCNRQQE